MQIDRELVYGITVTRLLACCLLCRRLGYISDFWGHTITTEFSYDSVHSEE